MAGLGLHCWEGFPLFAVSGGSLVVGGHGLLFVVASLVAEHRAQALGRVGPVVVARGPSCSEACGVISDQGSDSCVLRWQVGSLPLRREAPFACSFVLQKLLYIPAPPLPLWNSPSDAVCIPELSPY